MKLIKIEEGLCRGNVVFHAHQTRTPAEIRKQVDGLKSKKELKEKRKKKAMKAMLVLTLTKTRMLVQETNP